MSSHCVIGLGIPKHRESVQKASQPGNVLEHQVSANRKSPGRHASSAQAAWELHRENLRKLWGKTRKVWESSLVGKNNNKNLMPKKLTESNEKKEIMKRVPQDS